MSEEAAGAATAAAAASEAIQEVQKIDNIEDDLEDTAIAVATTAFQPPEPQGPTETMDSAPDASVSTSQVIDQAEAMEAVLEQAIPPEPSSTSSMSMSNVVAEQHATGLTEHQAGTAAAAEEAAAASESAVNDAPIDVTLATAVSDPTIAPSTSHEQTSLAEVPAVSDASVAIPSMPIADQNPEDVLAQTAHEEATSPILVDVEMQNANNTHEAVVNPEDQPFPPTTSTEPSNPTSHGDRGNPSTLSTGQNGDVGQSAISSAPQDIVAPNGQASTSQLPMQTWNGPQGLHPPMDLPAGLTANSPSVLSNPELMRRWSQGLSEVPYPQNPTVLLSLFTSSVQKTDLQDARAWYSQLAELEPLAIQPMLALLNLELAFSNFDRVEALFATALQGTAGEVTVAADVSVWKAYLHYIRRKNPIDDNAADTSTTRGTIGKAYELALQECGVDRESGDIWQEYISFVGEANPKSPWDTQQQMDNIRKIYQRAICIPLNNVETLWKSYDAFESGLNKVTAKKFLAERSPAYMTARTSLRELRNLTDKLPKPPLPPIPSFTDKERASVGAWKTYLKWEESNPLSIEDPAILNGRIKYALRQCLGNMRHFPELWHYAAYWHVRSDKKEEAVAVLDAGIKACPRSPLLTYAIADLQEELHNNSAVHTAYEALVEHFKTDLEALKSSIAEEVERVKGSEIPAQLDGTANGDSAMETARLTEEREARGKTVTERRSKEITELATAATVVWVMYMRFTRRAEGLKAARAIFGKARKYPDLTWHMFEASAMMEYHSNKDSSVAIRIFELGLKTLSEEVEYVMKYMQFLLSINDDTNARALFERSTAKIPADVARPLWDAWARYEYMFGDLSGVHKLEARFAEAFPNDSPLKRFAQQFTYNNIDEVAIRDLGFGRRMTQPPGPSSLPQLPPPIDLPTAQSIPSQTIPSQTIPVNAMTTRSPPPKRNFSSHSPPRRGSMGRGSADRSQSPSAKRYRPTGSPPPGRRFPVAVPERERIPSGGRYGHDGRASLPPPPPPQGSARGSVPPAYGPPPAGYDRSGLAQPLVWFMDTLPSTRAFDGPIFRPDDIMGLFGSIGRDGVGLPLGPPPNQGYQEPNRGFGGPTRRY